MAKVTILKKHEPIEQLKKKLQGAQENIEGIDGSQYSNCITLREDPVEYQKRIRDEWN